MAVEYGMELQRNMAWSCRGMKHRAVKEYGEQLQWIGVLGEWGMHAIAVDWSVGGMGYACNCSGLECWGNGVCMQLQWIGVLGEWGMHAIAVDWSVGGMGYACNCSGIEEAVAVEYRTQLQWNMAWSCSGMEEAVAVEYGRESRRNMACKYSGIWQAIAVEYGM